MVFAKTKALQGLVNSNIVHCFSATPSVVRLRLVVYFWAVQFNIISSTLESRALYLQFSLPD